MSPTRGADDPGRTFRRIVLALDTATTTDIAVVEQMASLAARLHGELMTLLVEDTDLARLAEHGGMSAFSVVSTTGRPLAAQHLRDALRLQAARLRRAMQEAAMRQQVRCAFEVRRGRLLAEVLDTAVADDLLVIGWRSGAQGSWPATAPPAAAITQALAEARARSVLLLHPRGLTGGPVLVAIEDAGAASHALTVAAQIADQDGGAIDVVLLHGRVAEAEQAGEVIAAVLAGRRISLQLIHAPKAGVQTLIEIAVARRSTLLVLGADRVLSEGEQAQRLLPRIPCSVLLLR